MPQIYYCADCAMEHRLPLKQSEIATSYCQICGTADIIMGNITAEEAEKRNIKTIKTEAK